MMTQPGGATDLSSSAAPSIAVALDTIELDVTDPLACLAGLRAHLGEQRVFLLESLAGPAADLRASIVGVTGLLEVSIYRSVVEVAGVPSLVEAARTALLTAGVIRTEGSTSVLVEDDGLFQVPRVLDAMFDVPRDPAEFGFGLLVVHGYDAVRYVEQLPRSIPDREHPAPDAIYSLVQALVEIDLVHGGSRLRVASSPAWPALDTDAVVAAASESGPSDSEHEVAVPEPVAVHDDTTREQYLGYAERCLEHIRVGDIYQVQIGHEISVTTPASDLTVYRRLRQRNPSPYMALLPIAGRTVVGASPELFLRLENGIATMRPIAGTTRRTGDPEVDRERVAALLADPKERAEHIMLVDLCRNDLGRVSETMSVEVDDFMHIEAYSHVFHIVSNVTSRLSPEYDVYDVIKASFPAGTMTGAPKVRAMEIIENIESSRRGLYAGSFGLVSFGGPVILGLGIRMAVRTDDTYVLRASAGIVADSTPDGEWRETLTKLGATYWAVTGGELR